MSNPTTRGAVAGVILVGFATAYAGTVTLNLSSPQEGAGGGNLVRVGMPIEWSITASVSTGDNEGLAFISVDLEQDPNNPQSINILPATGVPSGMESFVPPLGLSNPGPTSAAGYVGTPTGAAGVRNLREIGGCQNTFGVAGAGAVGTDADAVVGIGQSDAQLIASGSFSAPATPGEYTFVLANAVANVIDEKETPPEHSPVSAADVVEAEPDGFTVQVWEYGDTNCDGAADVFDIDSFVLAVASAGGQSGDYEAQFPDCDIMLADCNGDGVVDVFDIGAFVEMII